MAAIIIEIMIAQVIFLAEGTQVQPKSQTVETTESFPQTEVRTPRTSITSPKSQKNCMKCGSELPYDANFCLKCGQKQEEIESLEVRKYRSYLEKLEEKHRSGEVSEELYQKLRDEYSKKLKELEQK
jgi:predicted amidophosphoribosyltransferase